MAVLIILLCVFSFAAACGSNGDDDDNGDNDTGLDDDSADDTGTNADDDSSDDSAADDTSDDDTAPPPAPCDIRGDWHATITDKLLGDRIVILVVETRDYNPMYGAYMYDGCTLAESEYTPGIQCPARTYTGESNEYEFRFIDLGTGVARWYEGDITSDCSQYIGNLVETWPCCSAIYSPMTAYKLQK